MGKLRILYETVKCYGNTFGIRLTQTHIGHGERGGDGGGENMPKR